MNSKVAIIVIVLAFGGLCRPAMASDCADCDKAVNEWGSLAGTICASQGRIIGPAFMDPSFAKTSFTKSGFTEANFSKPNFSGAAFTKAQFTESSKLKPSFTKATFADRCVSSAPKNKGMGKVVVMAFHNDRALNFGISHHH